MPTLNETHDPSLTSWIESAQPSGGGCDFTIQNLPFGVFTRNGTSDAPSIGIAIGDQILDLKEAIARKRLDGLPPETACALSATTLNDFAKQGRVYWSAARSAISSLLSADNATLRDDAAARAACLVAQADATMHLPLTIGDYTDFYASINHATNVGSMFRPDNPLLPNYVHIPIGYHGRASSVVPSGSPVRRPCGQTKADDADRPTFGPCKLLDYELEMGVVVGRGNELGEPIDMANVADHLFGMVILNDWSARDIQKWEYQPLGPFNAKNFASTISPWVVTFEALAPYLIDGPPRKSDQPQPLPYIQSSGQWGIDMTVEASIASPTMREQGTAPHRVSSTNFSDMYWTVAQMLVHHASGGCNMQPGDLLGTGTISGTADGTRGCLLETTWRGQHPVELPDGTQRKFLADGDEVIMTAHCEKSGAARVGFGECRGVVEPAAS